MCITPITLKKSKLKHTFDDELTYLKVPCGKCIECRKARVNQWFVRLSQELKRSTSAYFVTLTYDDQYLPYTDNLNDTLNYNDIVKFIKRLRKKQAKKHTNKLRYYAVGEYGSTYNRPHYHALIFNVDKADDIVDEWKLGFVHIGKVEPQSIYYTLKYTLKSSVNEKDETTDRLPEKALMSKGLGENFLTDEVKRRYKHQPERPMILLDGVKLNLPRYYRDKIFIEKDGSKRIDLLQKRRILSQKYIEKSYDKTLDPIYPQRIQKIYNDVRKKIQKTD